MTEPEQRVHVLVAHGYEMKSIPEDRSFWLSDPAIAICGYLRHRYQREEAELIELGDDPQCLLLGGFDSKELLDLNDRKTPITIGVAMKKHLIKNLLPSRRLVTQYDLEPLQRFGPARDSVEEVILLCHYLNWLKSQGKLVTYESLVADPWAPRVENVYRYFGLDSNAIQPVPLLHRDMLTTGFQVRQTIAEVVSFVDPPGTSLIGRPFQKIRKERTFIRLERDQVWPIQTVRELKRR